MLPSFSYCSMTLAGDSEERKKIAPLTKGQNPSPKFLITYRGTGYLPRQRSMRESSVWLKRSPLNFSCQNSKNSRPLQTYILLRLETCPHQKVEVHEKSPKLMLHFKSVLNFSPFCSFFSLLLLINFFSGKSVPITIFNRNGFMYVSSRILQLSIGAVYSNLSPSPNLLEAK